MESSPHNASEPNASIEPPDVPDCWRIADLEEQARRAVMADSALRKQAEARQAAVVAQLETADTKLKAGDADGVLTALQAISAVDLQASLAQNGTVRNSADALAEGLVTASRRALRNGTWSRAGRFAAALLVLEPSSQQAANVTSQARTGQDLTDKLKQAKDAARRRKWKVALRTALAVLAVQKDFPGAAAVVADARHALAPKPKPTAANRTGSSTQTIVKPPTTTAPQPPPP